LLCGAAVSWALTESQLHRMSMFHNTCLRRIMGIARLHMGLNGELFEGAGMPCLSELLRRHRLRWLGHVARMPNERWAKQLLFAHEVPGGPGGWAGPMLCGRTPATHHAFLSPNMLHSPCTLCVGCWGQLGGACAHPFLRAHPNYAGNTTAPHYNSTNPQTHDPTIGSDGNHFLLRCRPAPNSALGPGMAACYARAPMRMHCHALPSA
jgi:hypothetical protein